MLMQFLRLRKRLALTTDDFKNTPSELSDEELAGVAGGCGMSAINGWTVLGAVMQEGVGGVGSIFGRAVGGIEKMTGKDII